MAITYGSEYPFNSLKSIYVSSAKIDETHFISAYTGTSNYGYVCIGTISGTSISYGSEYVFNSYTTRHISVDLIDSTHFVVSYQGTNNYGYSIIGTISNDDEVAYGSEYVFNSAVTSYISVAGLDATHFIISFSDDGGDDYGIAMMGTVSNINEIAFGAEYIFNSATTDFTSVVKLDASHFVVGYRGGNSSYGTAIIGDVSSGSIHAFGSEYVFNEANSNYISVVGIDATHFVIAYRDIGNSSYGTAIVGTVTIATKSIAYGSEYAYNEGQSDYNSISLIDATHFVVAYKDVGNSNYGTAIIGTISSVNQIAYGTEYPFNSAVTNYTSVAGLSSTTFAVSYTDAGNSNYGTAIHGTIAGDGWNNTIMGVATPAKINGVAVASIASVNGV